MKAEDDATLKPSRLARAVDDFLRGMSSRDWYDRTKISYTRIAAHSAPGHLSAGECLYRAVQWMRHRPEGIDITCVTIKFLEIRRLMAERQYGVRTQVRGSRYPSDREGGRGGDATRAVERRLGRERLSQVVDP